jgi:hypothetical protein
MRVDLAGAAIDTLHIAKRVDNFFAKNFSGCAMIEDRREAVKFFFAASKGAYLP